MNFNKSIVTLGLLGLLIAPAHNLQAEAPAWLNSLAPKVGAVLAGVATFYASQKLTYHLFYKNRSDSQFDRRIEAETKARSYFLTPQEQQEYRQKQFALKETISVAKSLFAGGLCGVGALCALPLCWKAAKSSMLPIYAAASSGLVAAASVLYQIKKINKKQSTTYTWLGERIAHNIMEQQRAEQQEREARVREYLRLMDIRDQEAKLNRVKLDAERTQRDKQIHFEDAAVENHLENMQNLLAQGGINVNGKTKWTHSPLMSAVKNQNLAMVNLLLAQPSLDINATAKNNPNLTALRYAFLLSAKTKENEIFLKIVNALLNDPRTDLNPALPYIEYLQRHHPEIGNHDRLREAQRLILSGSDIKKLKELNLYSDTMCAFFKSLPTLEKNLFIAALQDNHQSLSNLEAEERYRWASDPKPQPSQRDAKEAAEKKADEKESHELVALNVQKITPENQEPGYDLAMRADHKEALELGPLKPKKRSSRKQNQAPKTALPAYEEELQELARYGDAQEPENFANFAQSAVAFFKRAREQAQKYKAYMEQVD